jgi:hypothetical protein
VTDLTRELESLVPPFSDSDADWPDALRRSGSCRRWPIVLTAAAIAAGALAATSFGTAAGGEALDRFAAWVSGAPGKPASEHEIRALREANARSAAPIPAETELGRLARKSINGVGFELLGFRDRASLCLRLRSSAGEGNPIVKAPASCVLEEVLIDLGKPLAVVAAADPFRRRAKRGLQALYGLAADNVAVVELETEAGVRRVAVANNAFLYLYEGEGPRLTDNRLDYRSDVPLRATALDTAGGVLGSVQIMSLKRGYPGAPPADRFPGPAVVERPIEAPRVGWLDRREERGEPYEWGLFRLQHTRILRPHPAMSLRVVVGVGTMAFSGGTERTYCLATIWPLQPRPTGMVCIPVNERFGSFASAAVTPMFDGQFPVHYGLVPDGIASLELVLANANRSEVPLLDNVFLFQTASAQPAKIVGYDEDGRVALIRMIEPTP